MRHLIAIVLIALVLIVLAGCHKGFSLGYGYSSGYQKHPAPYCPPPHHGHGHHGHHRRH